MIAITDPDLLPTELLNAQFDERIIKFYDECKRAFPGIYVNGRSQRYNNWCGYRTQNCTIGAKNSAHKQGKAIDMHLPKGQDLDLLRKFCCKNGPVFGIMRMENRQSTPTWVHIDTMETENTRKWNYDNGIYVFAP